MKLFYIFYCLCSLLFQNNINASNDKFLSPYKNQQNYLTNNEEREILKIVKTELINEERKKDEQWGKIPFIISMLKYTSIGSALGCSIVYFLKNETNFYLQEKNILKYIKPKQVTYINMALFGAASGCLIHFIKKSLMKKHIKYDYTVACNDVAYLSTNINDFKEAIRGQMTVYKKIIN